MKESPEHTPNSSSQGGVLPVRFGAAITIFLVILFIAVLLVRENSPPAPNLMREAILADDPEGVRHAIELGQGPNTTFVLGTETRPVTKMLISLATLSYELCDGRLHGTVSALSFSVLRGKNNAALALLQSGANPNVTDMPICVTPICFAAAGNDLKTVQLLLKYDAAPLLLRPQDHFAGNAIEWASYNMNIEMVKLLEQAANKRKERFKAALEKRDQTPS